MKFDSHTTRTGRSKFEPYVKEDVWKAEKRWIDILGGQSQKVWKLEQLIDLGCCVKFNFLPGREILDLLLLREYSFKSSFYSRFERKIFMSDCDNKK